MITLGILRMYPIPWEGWYMRGEWEERRDEVCAPVTVCWKMSGDGLRSVFAL